MTNLRQAAQQALEALEQFKEISDFTPASAVHAIAALRAALAEPEQEPVAWAEEIIEDLHALYDTEMIRENDSGDALIRLDDAIACVEDAKQHHTAPTPRKPLTDEKIERNWLFLYDKTGNIPDYHDFARAIERAHGIRSEE